MKSMKLLSAAVFAAACVSALSGPARAMEVKGINFSDELTLDHKKLTLNGIGLRQATFLKVNVYAGALYLENKSNDGEKIAQSPELKHIEMVFLRDVDAGKISEAWAEGFEKNCAEDCDAAKPGIAKLQSITQEMKKGDKLAFNFAPDRVEVSVKSEKPVTIEGKEFAKNLIRLWIGKRPPNSELKEGMLGTRD